MRGAAGWAHVLRRSVARGSCHLGATAARLVASLTPDLRQSTAGLISSMRTRSLFCEEYGDKAGVSGCRAFGLDRDPCEVSFLA